MEINIEIQINIWTARWDDESGMVEGTWHGNDDSGHLQGMVISLIQKLAGEQGYEKAEVSLFRENGGDAHEETTHGEFICWRDGVPR